MTTAATSPVLNSIFTDDTDTDDQQCDRRPNDKKYYLLSILQQNSWVHAGFSATTHGGLSTLSLPLSLLNNDRVDQGVWA